MNQLSQRVTQKAIHSPDASAWLYDDSIPLQYIFCSNDFKDIEVPLGVVTGILENNTSFGSSMIKYNSQEDGLMLPKPLVRYNSGMRITIIASLKDNKILKLYSIFIDPENQFLKNDPADMNRLTLEVAKKAEQASINFLEAERSTLDNTSSTSNQHQFITRTPLIQNENHQLGGNKATMPMSTPIIPIKNDQKINEPGQNHNIMNRAPNNISHKDQLNKSTANDDTLINTNEVQPINYGHNDHEDNDGWGQPANQDVGQDDSDDDALEDFFN